MNDVHRLIVTLKSGKVVDAFEIAIEESPFALTIWESATERSVIPMANIEFYDVLEEEK